jgi:integrase
VKTADIKYLSPIRNLFTYLVDLGIIDRNPLGGIASTLGDDQLATSPKEERLPFEPEKIAALRRIADTKPRLSPDRWWIRIMPRTGARLEELARLAVPDIRIVNGRLCLDLLHLDDGSEMSRQRRKDLKIKTSAGRRIVPVCDALIDDGFVEFVEERRRRGGDSALLFPTCTPDKHGHRSSSLSKRLNRDVDKVIKDP